MTALEADAGKTTRRGLLAFTVENRDTLYKAYMGSVKYGALFVPTTQSFHLGDPVFILMSFAETSERVSVSGRVVWITPAGAPGKRPQGVGVQFQPPESVELQRKIEAMLAGHDATQVTYTL